jgi:hypothetical protein
MSQVGEAICAKIDAGALPVERPDKIFAGHGENASCCVCDTEILPVQVEWSLRDGERVTHRFHLGCYGLWEAQLRKRGAPDGGRDRQLEAVTVELEAHPSGVCLSCLSDLTMLRPDAIAGAVGRLAHTVRITGRDGVCRTCGYERYLLLL